MFPGELGLWQLDVVDGPLFKSKVGADCSEKPGGAKSAANMEILVTQRQAKLETIAS